MKRILFSLLFALPLLAAAQRTSVTAAKVSATDKICLRGVCITVWPTGGGPGTAWDISGNTGATSSNKLGTLDNTILRLISNNKILLTLLGSDSSVRIKTRIAASDSSDQGATTAWATLNIVKYLTSSNNSVLLSSVGKVINMRVNPDSFYNKTEVNNYITNVLNGSAGAWLKAGNANTDINFDYFGTSDSNSVAMKAKGNTLTVLDAAGYTRHTANVIHDSVPGNPGNTDSYSTTYRGAAGQYMTVGLDGLGASPGSSAGSFNSSGSYAFNVDDANNEIRTNAKNFRFLGEAVQTFNSATVPYKIGNSVAQTTGFTFEVNRRNAYNTARPVFQVNPFGKAQFCDSCPSATPPAMVSILAQDTFCLYMQNLADGFATDTPLVIRNGQVKKGVINNLANLSISAELASGGSTTYNGSVAKSIAIQPSSVTNAMLAGGIDLTLKVTGKLPAANMADTFTPLKIRFAHTAGATGQSNASINLNGNSTSVDNAIRWGLTGGFYRFNASTIVGDMPVLSLSNLSVNNAGQIYWGTRTALNSGADGRLNITNNAGTSFTRFTLGLETTSFPSLTRNGAALQVTLGDGSALTAVESLYQRYGNGSPESVVTAPVGAVYHRTDGGTGTSFYVKESGTGNTGWIAK